MAAMCLTQEAPYRLEIVAVPYAEDEEIPQEFFTEDKRAKNGKLKSASIKEFAEGLARVKPIIFVAHLEAPVWIGVNAYLEAKANDGESVYSLGAIIKLVPKKDGFELQATVSDGQLRSNLSFADSKFLHRDKFVIEPGAVFYRTPRGKLRGERILLLFSMTKAQ